VALLLRARRRLWFQFAFVMRMALWPAVSASLFMALDGSMIVRSSNDRLGLSRRGCLLPIGFGAWVSYLLVLVLVIGSRCECGQNSGGLVLRDHRRWALSLRLIPAGLSRTAMHFDGAPRRLSQWVKRPGAARSGHHPLTGSGLRGFCTAWTTLGQANPRLSFAPRTADDVWFEAGQSRSSRDLMVQPLARFTQRNVRHPLFPMARDRPPFYGFQIFRPRRRFALRAFVACVAVCLERDDLPADPGPSTPPGVSMP